MKSKHIKHKQVESQDLGHPGTQSPDVAVSCLANSTTNLPIFSQHIKCITPMTFSQKMYRSNFLEIAEEFEQALADNSLEKIKILLDKLLR